MSLRLLHLVGLPVVGLCVALGPLSGCNRDPKGAEAAKAEAPPAAQGSEQAPAGTTSATAASSAPAEKKPLLGIRGYATLVYAKPDTRSERLGYLRVGATVPRSDEPVGKRGCKGGWYQIEPRGYVCAGPDATTDLDDPLLRAASLRPRLDVPLPYRYGFVRSVLPLYLRVPPAEQQHKAEFKLGEHLEWFKQHKDEIQTATLGAWDVPVDEHGRSVPGKKLGELGRRKNSTELSVGELFGGRGDDDPWPFWLRESERAIPNVSDFEVPDFAWFANRARRHTGLAFVGSFATGPHYLGRRFGITTDLRLAPTSKVKPDSGSPWHGVELGQGLEPPIAFVRMRGISAYRVGGDGAEVDGELERRSVHQLTGKVKKVEGERYYQLAGGKWARAQDVGVVVPPRKWPAAAKKGDKWIEVDLSEQVLVLWRGTKAEFATLVSTGRPAVGDPKATYSTIRGVFRIYAKHISATMDSDEGMGRKKNSDDGLKPGDEGYVPSKGDGVYGVTLRRGHGLFKLRDVPHIQYFHKNYALHGAYWHDVFGIPRSHGCINLAPADSLRVFKWTEPQVPDGWHGLRTEGGTTVIVHQ